MKFKPGDICTIMHGNGKGEIVEILEENRFDEMYWVYYLQKKRFNGYAYKQANQLRLSAPEELLEL